MKSKRYLDAQNNPIKEGWYKRRGTPIHQIALFIKEGPVWKFYESSGIKLYPDDTKNYNPLECYDLKGFSKSLRQTADFIDLGLEKLAQSKKERKKIKLIRQIRHSDITAGNLEQLAKQKAETSA